MSDVGTAAIDWMVRLTAGHAVAADHAAFSVWLAADPTHRAAWDRLAGVVDAPIAQLQAVEQRAPGQLRAAQRALAAPVALSRRRLLGGATVLVVGGGAGYLTARGLPLTEFGADLRTGTAERHSLELADGSALVLNARTAVDIDTGGRGLWLREGELVATVAPADQPFAVRTAHGVVTGRGRLLVRRERERSLAVALAGELDIAAVRQRQRLQTGEGAWFGQGIIERVQAASTASAAWVDGLLDVQDEPLGVVVAALSRYRSGWLRVSPAAARLRVFGVFPLDDVDRALQALVEVLPIRVSGYGPWLAMIDLR